MLPTKTALIAGASGLIGRRSAGHLLDAGGWNVIGLALDSGAMFARHFAHYRAQKIIPWRAG